MKPVIVFVAAFVVAAAGGTGAKMMLTKPAVVKDSTAAHGDSTAAAHAGETAIDTAAVASGAPVTPPVDTALHAVGPAAQDTSNHSAPAVKDAAPSTTPAGPVQAGTAIARKQANDTASERRIAKVFGSMDAKQAAKVLEHMDDNDVSVILAYVGPRQAASIMAALPPERVAKVSKLAMLGGGAK